MTSHFDADHAEQPMPAKSELVGRLGRQSMVAGDIGQRRRVISADMLPPAGKVL